MEIWFAEEVQLLGLRGSPFLLALPSTRNWTFWGVVQVESVLCGVLKILGQDRHSPIFDQGPVWAVFSLTYQFFLDPYEKEKPSG